MKIRTLIMRQEIGENKIEFIKRLDALKEDLNLKELHSYCADTVNQLAEVVLVAKDADIKVKSILNQANDILNNTLIN
jgi:hypothetical protein